MGAIKEALTFDDVTLVPQFSSVLPYETNTKTELKKALDLIAKGKGIDYEGATAVNFTDVGEAFGSFLEKEVKGGKFKTKKQR